MFQTPELSRKETSRDEASQASLVGMVANSVLRGIPNSITLTRTCKYTRHGMYVSRAQASSNLIPPLHDIADLEEAPFAGMRVLFSLEIFW